MTSPLKLDLGQLLREQTDWIEQHKGFTVHQKRMLRAISECRTAALGAHEIVCTDCGAIQYAYNSCRNRNCPKCQNRRRNLWLEARAEELLPVPYFHLVFTLPSALHKLCLHHPKVMYGLLFEATWYTVNKLGKDPKWVGAQLGMIAILHTWGSNLSLHPHLHCMVPAGGLDENGRWKSSKSKGKYLFNRGVMGQVFRARYVKLLRKAIGKGLLPKVEDGLFKELFKKQWITYAKRPFIGPSQILNYIGRYTHKIAITNHRIEKVEKDSVYFWMKNYRKGGAKELTHLSKRAFIQRFALHIVPHKFIRIRHYGILSNRNKKQALQAARKSLGVPQAVKKKAEKKEPLPLNHYPHYCSCCQKVTVHLLLAVVLPTEQHNNCRGSPKAQDASKVNEQL